MHHLSSGHQWYVGMGEVGGGRGGEGRGGRWEGEVGGER